MSTSTVAIDLRKYANRSNGNSQQTTANTNSLVGFFQALRRKKPLDGRTETNLNRCLNLLDLTTLGVGSTLGLGLYVLAGQVASNKAGPAVVISFALAALASAFSALCYAEFAGRVPRAGSAYAYSYITVGEFVAFIIGWNLILEYVIGASSVARGFSGYLRFVCHHLMENLSSSSSSLASNQSNITSLTAPMTTTLHSDQLVNQTLVALVTTTTWIDSFTDYLIKYFDWPSIAIVLLLTGFILFGVKESTNVTLAFTAVNILVVVTVVLSSLKSLDLHNWQLTKEELPAGGNHGEGGFMPFGWSGVLAGSATCFFGFIGFDTIASSAEEAKNPKRNVPLAIVLSLFISFVAYMAIAIVQTLLWPYYDQDNITILPYIFDRLHMPITYWIVLLGAIAGLASSQLGGMYPLPRILYSMAQDKLIYSQLAHINRRLKLPVRATIVGSIFIASLACLLDIQDLADMVSIGTLAAYSLVSLSVLIVRYENRPDVVDDSTLLNHRRLSFNDILTLANDEQNLDNNNSQQQLAASSQLESSKEIVKVTTLSNECIKNKQSQTSQWNKSTRKNISLLDLLITTTSTTSNTSDDDGDQSIKHQQPDDVTDRQSKILISAVLVLTIMLDIVALGLTSSDIMQLRSVLGTGEQQHMLVSMIVEQQYLNPKLVLISSGCIVLVALAAVTLMLSRLPTSNPSSLSDMFLVPLVPLIPTLSIFVNTFLMLNLSYLTWVRFTVWMAVGFFIYFTYGIWNSEGYLLHVNA